MIFILFGIVRPFSGIMAKVEKLPLVTPTRKRGT